MSVIAIISALLRTLALGWATLGLWRLRDLWLAPLVGLLAASLVPTVIGVGDAASAALANKPASRRPTVTDDAPPAPVTVGTSDAARNPTGAPTDQARRRHKPRLPPPAPIVRMSAEMTGITLLLGGAP